MKTIVALALLFAVSGQAQAQTRSGDAQVARSVSGQFVAYPSTSPYPSRFYQADANSIPTEAALLAVSGERIKQVAWRMLNVSGSGTDKIYLHLRSARSAQEPATIVVQRVLNEWAYHIDIPDSLEQTTFVRTVVQAVLMEVANRNSNESSSEIPLWLAEGFSQQLLESENAELLVPPTHLKANGSALNRLVIDAQRKNPLQEAKAVLRDRAPLTFEQLSWPTGEQLHGEAIPVFRSSAQLFVRQLLNLKNGPACLRAMLEQLPRRLNWQFALLDGFEAHFHGLLDVEKWWALQVVEFTGRDLAQTWTPEESWLKLDEIVHFSADLRSSVSELPRRTDVTLQTVIREWDAVLQQQTLRRKAQELDLIRARVAQDLIAVVDDYRQVLATYLKKQNFSGSFFSFKKQTGPIRNRLAEQTIKQLDILEAKRNAARPTAQQLTLNAASAVLSAARTSSNSEVENETARAG